ncbi:hypothetical protein Tco_1428272 [Tanacetum coccineum]
MIGGNIEVEDETNVEAEKTEEVVKESEVANVSGSQETRNEQMQTLIPSLIRFPRNEGLAGIGQGRNLICSHIKNKFITREFFMEKIQEVLQCCDKIIPELKVTKTNEMLKKEMPRLVKLAVNKDREASQLIISVWGRNMAKRYFEKKREKNLL